ncbi:hypothetical protein EDB81DRAFT_640559 [Dactylonectria macrodidyma]|uniref:Uncharacterized protein n=1 Tax=Dactylonectria macrodidyma TaxID=307937 RepID=A0A9P9FLH9_9HYPO|nr:hypothetical protein EDB81DRAFT_640559 [Dactylonectria macrodidyma]
MASPTPDASAVESKSRDPVVDKEQKPEVNGHATPVDTQNGDEKPSVNGNKDNHPVTNGVTKDVEMEDNSDTQSKTANETTKEDSNSVTKPEPSAESIQTDESKPSVTEPTPASEDVEMADATSDTKPTEDKPEDKPNKAKSSTSEEPKDAEMTDKPSGAPKVNGTGEAPPSSDDTSAPPASQVDLQPASLSQLAIETTEAESSDKINKPATEVTMEDAPAATDGATPTDTPTTADPPSSTKVAREREDDATDEPAPKRAKTELSEDEPMATAEPAAVEASLESQELPFTGLAKWNDSEFNEQKITPHQRREIRKVLGRIKKTKQGGHFRDSVQKLWPGLWESYLAKIEKPTDLSEIDRTMRDPSGAYVTLAHFKQDLILMYTNTLAYNGPLHDVTRAAQGSIEAIWRDVSTISPEEEPPKPKPAPKQKAPRESRTATHVEPSSVRKQSAGPAPSPVVESRKPSPMVQAQAADARRASTGTEGDRPKRTVRAPKPKDIDYTTKPSRKKLKPELQFSEEVLNEIMHPKNKHINSWFMEAVDAEGLGIPHYYSMIKKPMDLGKVSRLLASGDITSLKDFDKNVRLIFANCYAFNGTVDQGNAVSFVAKQLEDFYNAQMKGKDAWLAKHAKANAPPPASHASDEEEEEEFEGDEAAAPTVDSSKEVRELEAKLREESEKLTDLFAADSPNESLIMVQQGILKMVQEALLAAKQKLAEYRQKHDKPGKKPSKPSKAKSGNSAPRKPTGNAVPKKSGGTKKAATKKNLSAADKDQIANAINDLEYPHLDRAIDIIKRDTGQAENNDGELELDIDQLSNEALLKLWELCRKVLPGFSKEAAQPVSSPEVTRPSNPKQSKNAAKPKKNKPMSAREQEERIAQLRGLRDLYKPGQDSGDGQNVTQAPTPTAESSDDSDSEEE